MPDEMLPSRSESELHIKSLKNTKATGIDKVHNSLIKNLPRHGVLYLHLIILSCFKLGYFPKAWKCVRVVAISKPGKKKSDPASYRPISLSKILEKAILKRLNSHINERNIIPRDQCGFVPGKSTSTQLFRIKNHIHQALNSSPNLSTGMILIDVEKAFDGTMASSKSSSV